MSEKCNTTCSVMYWAADGSLCLFHIFQVPITSGDSGSLPCADMPSVLLRPIFFIYRFVFNHSHSVDQKPRDNLMSWQWDFFFCSIPSKVVCRIQEVGLWVLEPHSSSSFLFFLFFLSFVNWDFKLLFLLTDSTPRQAKISALWHCVLIPELLKSRKRLLTCCGHHVLIFVPSVDHAITRAQGLRWI